MLDCWTLLPCRKRRYSDHPGPSTIVDLSRTGEDVLQDIEDSKRESAIWLPCRPHPHKSISQCFFPPIRSMESNLKGKLHSMNPIRREVARDRENLSGNTDSISKMLGRNLRYPIPRGTCAKSGFRDKNWSFCGSEIELRYCNSFPW